MGTRGQEEVLLGRKPHEQERSWWNQKKPTTQEFVMLRLHKKKLWQTQIRCLQDWESVIRVQKEVTPTHIPDVQA